MKTCRRIWRRLVGTVAGSRHESELAAELESHIQMLTDENLRRGMSPADARRAAVLSFGGMESVKESCRDQRGFAAIDSMRQDLTWSWRMLRKTPGFTAVAVLSLAIGIGANTAVFGVLNAVLLKRLPVDDPGRLRVLTWAGDQLSVTVSGRMVDGPTGETEVDAFSMATYRQFRDHAPDLADVMASSRLQPLSVLVRREPFVARGLMVSGNFFRGLGLTAWKGRTLVPEDDRPGAEPVVVISHACWRNEFNLDPAVVGRTAALDGRVHTVVGVLPEGFAGVYPNEGTDVYVPLSAQPQLRPGPPLDSPEHWTLQIMARLRPDADQERATAYLGAMLNRAIRPEWYAKGVRRGPHRVVLKDGSRGYHEYIRKSAQPLYLLLGIAAVVLAVACANIAGLLLVRGAARQRELAVRVAIGAGRWRLIRQALTESLVVSLAGAALGLLLASWAKPALSRLIWPRGVFVDLGNDYRVFALALALSLVSALLSGLLPAVRAIRGIAITGLKDKAAVAPRLRAGRGLVSVQVGLSLLLLVTAGLFTRTLVNLYRVDTGFDTTNLLVFNLDATKAGYKDRQAVELYERVHAGIATLPGVRSVAQSDMLLLSGWMNKSVARVSGRPGDEATFSILGLGVSGSFFSTMGIPLLRGRGFSASDDDTALKVVIVNEALARREFPKEDPVGRELTTIAGKHRIVGVVGDMTYHSLKQEPEPTVFYDYRQRPQPFGRLHFEVRTSVDPLSLVPAVRQVVAGIDRRIPIADVGTQASQLDDSISLERGFAAVASGLAVLAVLLSCVGLYGVMAYHVARRTGEIGVRMALGSTAAGVAWPILRGALLVAAAGIGIGLPLVAAAGRIVRSYLFGVEPLDAPTLVGAIVLLLAIAAAGAAVPASRAARVDPAVALRCE